MNLSKIAIFVVLIATITIACKQNADKTEGKTPAKVITDPLVYDATVIAELTHVNHGLSAILDRISAADSLGILEQYRETTQQLDEGIQILKALPAMNDNTKYRDAALSIMQFHRSAMDNQYKRIVEISVKKKPSSREEEERETLYEQMENTEEKLDARFFQVRNEFGKQNKIQLPAGNDLQL